MRLAPREVTHPLRSEFEVREREGSDCGMSVTERLSVPGLPKLSTPVPPMSPPHADRSPWRPLVGLETQTFTLHTVPTIGKRLTARLMYNKKKIMIVDGY